MIDVIQSVGTAAIHILRSILGSARLSELRESATNSCINLDAYATGHDGIKVRCIIAYSLPLRLPKQNYFYIEVFSVNGLSYIS